MDERREARVAALRLAIQFCHESVSDSQLEYQADKFYNYIINGHLRSPRR